MIVAGIMKPLPAILERLRLTPNQVRCAASAAGALPLQLTARPSLARPGTTARYENLQNPERQRAVRNRLRDLQPLLLALALDDVPASRIAALVAGVSAECVLQRLRKFGLQRSRGRPRRALAQNR